jgi:hypothetical protein
MARKQTDPDDAAPAPVVMRGYLDAVMVKPGKDGAPPTIALRLAVAVQGLDLARLGRMMGQAATVTLDPEQLTLVAPAAEQ